MARVDTQRAIGAVTALLRDHLIRRGHAVTVGKPEQAGALIADRKLNLFLYEAAMDGSLRNVRLDEDGPPPLWMSLRYLVTAFDDDESSDSAEAHELLGQGLTALHELNFLSIDPAIDNSVRLALEHNPEPLKITFDEGTPDLLSKLMQGSDETYRLSAAIQVRPVLLLPAEPPRSTLLVGVDYGQDPPAEIGLDGVEIEALPTLGPRLDRVEPAIFEPGEKITLYGADLHLSGLAVILGDEPLRVTSQRSDRLTAEVESASPGPGGAGRIAQGLGPSAGELPLKVSQQRGEGRQRSSNLITGKLRPVVTSADIVAGALRIDGFLLGGDEDDVVVALFADGAVVRAFDVVATQDDQARVTVAGFAAAMDNGAYMVILRVNGVQARKSPTVVLS